MKRRSTSVCNALRLTLRGGKRATTITTATVTSKGQITIPTKVRQALKVEAGDKVEFIEVEPGRFEVVAAIQSVKALKGMFGRPVKKVSIDEMNRAIAARRSAAR